MIFLPNLAPNEHKGRSKLWNSVELNEKAINAQLTRKDISTKDLEQLRQESKEIKDKIDDTEERLRQLKNQEKKILKQGIIKRRKERTHRLITRGAILERLIGKPEELTDEEIKILLENQQRQVENQQRQENSKKHLE